MHVTAQMPDMGGYGVEPDTWKPLPWSWAAERLLAARNLWLVTASADGRPHSMPVWAVWDDDDHQLAFGCAPNARKVRNLAANPHAVVTTESTVEALSIEGSCALLEASPRFDQWAERWVDKYRESDQNVSVEFLVGNPFYVFTPTRAFAVIETPDEFSTRATRWIFS